jgi:hypothetical protein
VRAVAKPDIMTGDVSYTIKTDSVTWTINSNSATLWATLGSSKPVFGTVNVGFVIGDNDSITVATARVDVPITVSNSGVFSHNVAVYDNMGYWFRAYVKVGDEYYYGDARHYGLEMVDLGLASGTLWCNMNVGSSMPSDYGNYYAWGETATKESYTSATYAFGQHNIGENGEISGTDLDAAHVNMGNAWVMPTSTQWAELRDNCTWEYGSNNSITGFWVKSKANDNKIFLPCAGYMDGTGLYFDSQVMSYYGGSINKDYRGGSYWSSIQGGDNSWYAYTMSWTSGYSNARDLFGSTQYDPFWGNGRATVRYYGRPVRAVVNPNAGN